MPSGGAGAELAVADVLVGFEKKKLLLGESTPVLPILMQIRAKRRNMNIIFLI